MAVTRAVVIKRTPLDVPLLLFLASAVISSAFAENRNVALLGTYERYDGLLTMLTYAALFWLSVQSLADDVDARGLVRALLAGGYVVSGVAIAQSLRDSVAEGTIAPAFGTLGNANVLGAYLALVITLAVGELLAARSALARILLANELLVTGLALLLSLSRSAWLGTLAGIAFVAIARPRRWAALRFVLPAAAIAVAVLAIGYLVSSPGQLERTLVDRALSAVDPREIARARLGIWGDSVRLIASRPITGYGPDNVGLVFPRFQTGDWGYTYSYAQGNVRLPIDKTHAELLQVAATQGLIGVAAFLLLQIAFLRAAWRARHVDQAVAVTGGWIAYTVVVQLNFTALAAALPFWIFSAAAVVSYGATRKRVLPAIAGNHAASNPREPAKRRASGWLLAPGLVAAAALVWWGAAVPYVADLRLRQAVDADFSGHAAEAERLAGEARVLAPWESVYAVEVANTAFEQGHFAAARLAYKDAADLGTFNDMVYRNLALADRSLGLGVEGRAAAQKAVELDRFDPANQALLAEFEVGNP